MYDFEMTLRLLVTIAGSLGIVLAAGFGFKRLLRKSPPAVRDEQLTSIDSRLAGIEARMGELEERLDFTERMLGDVRGKIRLPGKR
jgi:hypothetical protein